MQEENKEPMGLAASMNMFGQDVGKDILLEYCIKWAETLHSFEIAPLFPAEREAVSLLVKALNDGLDLAGIPR